MNFDVHATIITTVPGMHDLMRHQDTVCPNGHRQYPLDNNRTIFSMPFSSDMRRSTFQAENRLAKDDSDNKVQVRVDAGRGQPLIDDLDFNDGAINRAAMKIPLNERPMSEKMQHVAKWIACNFDKPVKVRQAADLVAMSERTLLRHFTSEIGMAPSAYLMRVRLARACAMLAFTALPADSIARRCGLGSGEHLARLFRQHFDKTPIEYRRAHAHARPDMGAVERDGAGEAPSFFRSVP
ncbi:helix-turn-helix domain-containing protein [Burkholderia vietnamiensis]|uniref:helix-turn-helix domain-containing protein n=1 Tax=Burkholderia vietnamiensis TaxID=60552 RepID=UPI001E5C0FF1|nr:AraC family transcriptional regulator [Burkholderia vietnamiensis]